jgi:hypothetical protein
MTGLRTRWHALCREMGDAPTAALYVLHRLLGRLSGGRARIVPYALYAQPIGHPALRAVKPDPATVVRIVSGADAPLPPGPRPEAVVRQRLRDGNECHVCEVSGQFAGTIWLAHGQHDEDEVRCHYRLPPHSVWDHDVYVVPKYRLGRTVARLWSAVDQDLAHRGVAWTFSRISRFNRGSIGTHERLGARRVGTALFVCWGAWELSWVPGRRGPRLSRQARPLIQLQAPT